ncbi:MAG: DUF3540 domain-containing protein [Polyangiaceae bacterium]|nr:DUF3540 domain-containing protein [Polyangiaceae bacterium]NUQ72735.1 DUF3540 domain-containing protein [Polyangiaceae bacterium]
MSVAARRINPSLITEESGTVTNRRGGELTVELGSGVVAARRAFSCLVEPLEGDRVLVAVEASGRAYVLAVLERTREGAKTTLRAEGDLEIQAPMGTCSIAAQEGVKIASPGEVSLTSGELSINALRGKVVMEKLAFVGQWVQGELGKLKVLAESVDSVVTRVSERVARSYRTVDEIDQVKAGQMDYTAKEQIRMHAKNTIVTSDNLVKVDGDQIHFG